MATLAEQLATGERMDQVAIERGAALRDHCRTHHMTCQCHGGHVMVQVDPSCLVGVDLMRAYTAAIDERRAARLAGEAI